MKLTKKATALLLFSTAFICIVAVSAYVLWKNDVLNLPVAGNVPVNSVVDVDADEELYPAVDDGGSWGYISTDGEMCIEPEYQAARPFWGDAAWVKSDDLWGCIDKDGNWLVAPQYDEIKEYRSEGQTLVMAVIMAATDPADSSANSVNSVNSSLYNANGAKLFGLSGRLGEIHDGLMPFSRQKGEQQAWGYINAHGEIIIEPQYAAVGEASGNYALVRNFDGQTELLNIHAKTGTVIDGVDSLDAVGNRRILMRQSVAAETAAENPAEDINIEDSADNTADDVIDNVTESNVEKYGYLNVGGELLVDYIFDAAEPFRDGAALVMQDGLYGLLTADGAYALAPQFAGGKYLGSGLYAMKLVEEPGYRIYNALGEAVVDDVVYQIGEWVGGNISCQTESGTVFINENTVDIEKWEQHMPGVFRLGRLYGVADANGLTWLAEVEAVGTSGNDSGNDSDNDDLDGYCVVYEAGRSRELTDGVELVTVAECNDAAYMVYYPQIETTDETAGAAWRRLNSELKENGCAYLDEYKTRGELNYVVSGEFGLIESGAVLTVVQNLQLDDSWDVAGGANQVGQVEQVIETVCFDKIDGRQYNLGELFERNVNWRTDILPAARAVYSAQCVAAGQQENPEVQEILGRRLNRGTAFALAEGGLVLYLALSDGGYQELALSYDGIGELIDTDGELWQRLHLHGKTGEFGLE